VIRQTALVVLAFVASATIAGAKCIPSSFTMQHRGASMSSNDFAKLPKMAKISYVIGGVGGVLTSPAFGASQECADEVRECIGKLSLDKLVEGSMKRAELMGGNHPMEVLLHLELRSACHLNKAN